MVYASGALCWWLYNHTQPPMADAMGVAYAAYLLAGPSVIYVAARRAGAPARRSLLLTLGVPLLWLAKELWRVTAVHPVAEALYYALNPVSLGVFSVALVPAAAIEIGLRRRRTGAWRPGGWPGLTLAAFVLLAASAAVAGHGNGGRELFYAYIRLYRFLFAGGS